MSKVGKYLANAAVRKTDRSFFNGYTGMKTTGFATAAAFGAAGVWGAATYQPTKSKAEMQMSQSDYVGQAPVLGYDGVGNAPSLGASGSMVFGLHNMRKG